MPSFDADMMVRQRAAKYDKDPILIRLGGDEFRCLPVLPMGESIELAELPEDATDIQAAIALGEMMRAVVERAIVPEDRERFSAALANPDKPIDAEAMFTVCQFLVEVYTGRPTVPPVESSAGRRNTGAKSSTGSSPVGSKTRKTSRSRKSS
jgi:GGDEF domain-containing protein